MRLEGVLVLFGILNLWSYFRGAEKMGKKKIKRGLTRFEFVGRVLRRFVRLDKVL